MLIDERTQSAAEHLGLYLEAANDTKFVGEHTAGANGNVATFSLTGGILYSLAGVGVKHADDRHLQRIGLVPDVEVRPTVRGIWEGRDEVLDAAIEYLSR
jgi:C-terminal processing protease CtpA/Prc